MTFRSNPPNAKIKASFSLSRLFSEAVQPWRFACSSLEVFFFCKNIISKYPSFVTQDVRIRGRHRRKLQFSIHILLFCGKIISHDGILPGVYHIKKMYDSIVIGWTCHWHAHLGHDSWRSFGMSAIDEGILFFFFSPQWLTVQSLWDAGLLVLVLGF